MGTFRKLLKSKTIGEAVDTIPYGFFNIVSFVICLLFSIYPFVLLFFQSTFIGYIVIDWSDYRFYELGVGSVVLLLYLMKIIRDKRYKSFKSFATDNIPIVLFGIFILLMVISTAANGFTKLSLLGNDYRAEGLIGYLGYFVYFLLAYINSSKKLRRTFFYILTATATVLATILIYETVTENYNYSLNGSVIFYQHNHYGYYLNVTMVIMACLMINEKKLLYKLIFCAEFVISCIALLINNTLGAILALMVAFVFILIVYSIISGKIRLIALLPMGLFIAVCICSCFVSSNIRNKINDNMLQMDNDKKAVVDYDSKDYEDSTGVARLKLWKYTWTYIYEKPMLGFAADGTDNRLYADTHDNQRCHNEYLQYAVMFGIPAALIYIAGVFMVFIKGLKYRKRLSTENIVGLCTAFAYLVSAFIGNSLFYTAPYLFIMLGMGYFNNKNHVESSDDCDVSEKQITEK